MNSFLHCYHPRDRRPSSGWFTFLGCIAMTLLAEPMLAFAQPTDSAADLGRPPAPNGEAPATTRAAPPVSEAPAGYQTGTSSAPAQVPPPPATSGYGGAQGYPSTQGQGADSPDLRIPSRIATRLRVLDADLTYLAARGSNQIVDGILSIVTGGLAITLGIIIDEPNLSKYLYVYGGAGITRGVVELILNPDASGAAIDYAHQPMGTMAEVQQRLRFGETELESLANRSRLSRILSASINITAGVAFIPVYLAPNDFSVDAFGAIVLVTAGVSIVAGLINLFVRTEAERRWSAYEELRDRLTRGEESSSERTAFRRSKDGITLDFGAAATPDGAAVGLTGRF